MVELVLEKIEEDERKSQTPQHHEPTSTPGPNVHASRCRYSLTSAVLRTTTKIDLRAAGFDLSSLPKNSQNTLDNRKKHGSHHNK